MAFSKRCVTVIVNAYFLNGNVFKLVVSLHSADSWYKILLLLISASEVSERRSQEN